MSLSLLFPHLTVPRRSIIGAQEKLGFVGEREIARTVNGVAVALQPSFGTLYTVELSNSGDRVWTPSLENLRFGSLVRVWTQTWQSATLAPNATTVILSRDPVPNCVHARRADDETVEVPITVAGRQVTIPPRTFAVTILYRMALDCIVTDTSSAGSATKRDQSWTLKLEETGT